MCKVPCQYQRTCDHLCLCFRWTSAIIRGSMIDMEPYPVSLWWCWFIYKSLRAWSSQKQGRVKYKECWTRNQGTNCLVLGLTISSCLILENSSGLFVPKFLHQKIKGHEKEIPDPRKYAGFTHKSLWIDGDASPGYERFKAMSVLNSKERCDQRSYICHRRPKKG